MTRHAPKKGLTQHRLNVLEQVRQHPGATVWNVAMGASVPFKEAKRVLHVLQGLGLVARQDSLYGSAEGRWFPEAEK